MSIYLAIKGSGNCAAKETDVLNKDAEFSDIYRHYFGRWGEYFSAFFALLAFVGAIIVYWVLMSNFLYNIVVFIYGMLP